MRVLNKKGNQIEILELKTVLTKMKKFTKEIKNLIGLIWQILLTWR